MNKANKVLVLNHFAVPRGEPGGTRHVEMFARLQCWRHVIVASRLNLTTGNAQEARPGFMPVRVSAYSGNGVTRVLNWGTYFASSLVFGLRLRRNPPDIVYASSPHLLTGASGYLLSRLYKTPFVLEIRDLWPKVLVDMGTLDSDSLVFRMLTQLEHFLYRRADAIVTMASGTGSYLEQIGTPPEKVHYIPNGADPSDFAPSEGRDTLRTRYGFTRFTAVYTGAHGPANGLDVLLNVASALGDAELDIVLVGDGTEKQRLKEEAHNRGLLNVRFFDPMPKTEIPDLLFAADIGIHVLADVPLFWSAVSPNKLFDYMAAGLPIITNSRGVVERWVEDANAGWYVPTEMLADRFRELTRLGEKSLERRGSNGRNWIEEHQSRSAMAKRLQDLLNSLIQDSRGDARA